MADTLDALLGLNNNDDASTRALAKQLRDQQAYARYFSETSNPDVNKTSARELVDIQDNAQRLGTRRYNIGRDKIGDARNERTDKRADVTQGLAQTLGQERTAKHNRDMRSEIEYFEDADGNMKAYRYDELNNPVRVPEMDNMTPYDEYAGRLANKAFADKKDKYGNAYNRDNQGNMIFADGTPWTEDEAFRRSQRELDQSTTGAGSKKFKQDQAELASEFAGDAFKAAGTNRRIQRQMDSALSLIAQGAGTGAIEEDLLTIKDVTKALESLQADIGLERIGPLKLTPVSDVDLRKVFETSIPLGIDSEGLKTWLKFKRESFGILAEIQDYTYDILQGNDGVMPTGEEKKVMDAHIEELMNTGEYGLTMPNLKTGEVQTTDVEAPQVTTDEPDANGFIYRKNADGTVDRKKVR